MLQCEYNSVYFVCRKSEKEINSEHKHDIDSNGTKNQDN